MNIAEHKANAAAAGLEWSEVETLYREARDLEAAEIARRVSIRRAAFTALSGDAHGGRVKFARRDGWTTGDATSIPGIDVVAAGLGISADELYRELQSPAPVARPAGDTMADVIDRAAAMAGTTAGGMVPLVEAAAMADITEQWLRLLVKSGRVGGEKRGRNWVVRLADVQKFRRHPTAGRPRMRAHLETAPF